MKKAKYPIKDEELLALMKKYPFLRYHNYKGQQMFHGKSKNLEVNYYNYWDGNGWEDLWKNRYLPRLFKEYDKMSKSDKKSFRFEDIKEKFGQLRIYCPTTDEHLEFIATSLSEWICEDCGAEPRENGKRVIWTSSSGWIRNLCQDCARKYMKIDHPEWTKEELDVELEKQKVVNSKFGYTQFGKEHKKVTYKETEDGWLEVDKVEIEK